MSATIVRAVTAMFAGSKLHAKQIESVTDAIIGAMAAPSAGVASLGRSAATMRFKGAKRGIKQVDRLLSNRKIDDLDLVEQHVAFVVGSRRQIVLTLDWTEYGFRFQPARRSESPSCRPVVECPSLGGTIYIRRRRRNNRPRGSRKPLET
jgi:hypothetical protein